MLSKIIKYLGFIIIISFSALSVFFSLTERDIEDPRIKEKISYTTFFENRFFDFRMRQTLDPKKFDKKLVMADIDDYSLKELGQWPVGRQTWANVIDKLRIYGAKVIAFDVFFAENSMSCGETSVDDIMAQSIVNFQSIPGNKVILPYSLDTQGADHFEEMPDQLYNFVLDTKNSEGIELKPKKVSKAVWPIETLLNTDVSLGHIQVEADSDGIMRHYQLVGNIDTLYMPSYGLQAYIDYTGDSPVLEMLNIGDYKFKLASGNIELNYKGEANVRWFGNERQFPRVSIADIVKAYPEDENMKEIFNNTIVFVGASAYGAYDLRHTPVDPMLPGVYFHMNMTHMLLNGHFYKPQQNSTFLSWAILIGGSLIILIIQFFGNPILDLLSTIFIIGGIYYYDTYHLIPQGYEVKLFFCFFSIICSYSWNTFLHFYLANKDKAFLKNAFGSYISPELIDEMYSTGQHPSLGGDSGTRTAFFTDIQSFSTFSEKLSATQLVELLNEYLTAMTDILLEEKGTLDKYEGDAIIAFFGAPMPLEDHSTRALRVAVKMQRALLVLREKWVSEGDKWPQIVHEMRMRIGINTGEIVTGNMGSASRMNYTMMGDSVNLAARLEEAAKQYGIFTQTSKFTMEDCQSEQFLYRELDTIRVVGKSEPVTTYEILEIKEDASDLLIKLQEIFSKGISHYKAQEWDQALACFKESLELELERFPLLKEKTNPSKIYIERCEQFKELPPPPNWDGVFTLTSK
ncbi:putative transmembrane adenylate/guanylate cyclase [Halobacteriovorax marinus SJ]|uniref:Transmembrane adenylate/guanylate cyclase n=1 Tax=Halobacteriovorax marinus (strain ATCC BAA-682 / DSM 15412 / SJ) TaxID=862908 RepID=E1WZ05_HALMS|nr:adenylate/guanylate cyclase domain-containing protein [Halobacteriovorax marinus]CBW26102.1 putative transmembrane adenylate/guanylate cyclase [Halobacteriovorax marinus SJ]